MRILAIVLLLVSFQCFVTSRKEDQDAVQWVRDIFKNVTVTNNQSDSDIDLSPTDKDTNQGFDLSPNLNPTDDKNVACLLDNNENGICVLYYLCDPESRFLIADGASLIDIRERSCPHYLEVCCQYNKVIEADTEETEQSAPKNTQRPHQDSFPLADNNAVFKPTIVPTKTTIQPPVSGANQPSSHSEAAGACGWSHPLASIFAPVNNTEDRFYADFGEFPWMVAVMLKQPNRNVWQQDDYLGGGTIIHPSVIVTVAHKVNNITQAIKCRAGEFDTQTTKEQFPFQERDVKEVIVHPNYFRPSLYNDVALLILERKYDLELAPHIGVACLGQAMPSTGTTCFSMGWGKDFNKKNTYAVILKKIKMDLVGANDCQYMLQKNSRLGPYFQLHQSLTCAGGVERVDVCKGDGGSPLVCPVQSSQQNTRYVVYGMAAYGLGRCGTKGVPGVYVKVPHVYEWVQGQMAARGFGALEVV